MSMNRSQRSHRAASYSRRSLHSMDESTLMASSMVNSIRIDDRGGGDRGVLNRSGNKRTSMSRPRARMASTTSRAEVGDTVEVPILGNSGNSDEKNDVYATHRYLLNFINEETEQRYFEFQYVDNSFIPGKIFSLLWTGVAAVSFVAFTEPFSDGASYTVESFSSPWWIGGYISTVVCAVLWVGLFLDSLRHYREVIHLAQMFVGWPHLILIVLYIKQPRSKQ